MTKPREPWGKWFRLFGLVAVIIADVVGSAARPQNAPLFTFAAGVMGFTLGVWMMAEAHR